jgi:hypothetical protein
VLRLCNSQIILKGWSENSLTAHCACTDDEVILTPIAEPSLLHHGSVLRVNGPALPVAASEPLQQGPRSRHEPAYSSSHAHIGGAVELSRSRFDVGLNVFLVVAKEEDQICT